MLITAITTTTALILGLALGRLVLIPALVGTLTVRLDAVATERDEAVAAYNARTKAIEDAIAALRAA